MGTRSLTAIQDEGEEIALIYRQFDGYPTGHGAELKQILKNVRIVNGLGGDTKPVANGMGCLAAQVVAGLKKAPGGIYLYKPGTRDCWEQYVYTLYTGNRKQKNPSRRGLVLYIKVATDDGKVLYNGPLAGFNAAKAEANQ